MAHLILSPHFDDAVFSCGAAIHAWRAWGEPVWVLNICAAAPPAPPWSPLAEAFHRRMGHPEGVVATRRAEDALALASLGALVEGLDLPDGIYRGDASDGWYYPTMGALFGPVHAAEALLPERLAAQVARQLQALPAETVVYAPLGIGGHADHRVVHAVGWQLYGAGHAVAFYPDFPYADATQPHPLDAGNTATLAVVREAAPVPLTPWWLPATEADLKAQADAALAYASQLTLMFGEPASVPARMRQFAARRPGRTPGTCLWWPGPGGPPAAYLDAPA